MDAGEARMAIITCAADDLSNLSNKRTHEPLFTCSACRQNHQRHWLLKRKRTSWHWEHALWRLDPARSVRQCETARVMLISRWSEQREQATAKLRWTQRPLGASGLASWNELWNQAVATGRVFMVLLVLSCCATVQPTARPQAIQWVSIHQSHSAGKISPNKTVEVLRAVLISLLPGGWTGTDSSKWWLWWPTASWADGYSRGLHWSFFLNPRVLNAYDWQLRNSKGKELAVYHQGIVFIMCRSWLFQKHSKSLPRVVVSDASIL